VAKQLATWNNPLDKMKKEGIQVTLEAVFSNMYGQDKISSRQVQSAPTSSGILYCDGAYLNLIMPFHPGRASVKQKGKRRKRVNRRRRRVGRRQKENEGPTPMDWEPLLTSSLVNS
jgi:hypothetical protein